jgi:hypothetical protein
MTTETQIEVSFVNQPKEGQFSGNIKTKDGNTYGVSAKDLAQFKQGCSYVIEYEERAGTGKWAGRSFRDIKSAKLVSNTTAAGPNGATAGHNGTGGTHNQFRNPEQMFVEALLLKGIEMQSIGFLYEDVSKAGKWLREAYREIYGNG